MNDHALESGDFVIGRYQVGAHVVAVGVGSDRDKVAIFMPHEVAVEDRDGGPDD